MLGDGLTGKSGNTRVSVEGDVGMTESETGLTRRAEVTEIESADEGQAAAPGDETEAGTMVDDAVGKLVVPWRQSPMRLQSTGDS